MTPGHTPAAPRDPAAALAQITAQHAAMRAQLGLGGDGPLTIEEMRDASRQACARAITAAAREHAETRAGEDPMRFFYREPGNHHRDLPEYVRHTLDLGCWTADAAADLAVHAWSLVEWPGAHGAHYWRSIFEQVPTPVLTRTETPAPAGTVRAWRAAFSSEKRGMAWTTDPHVAKWFAARGDMTGKGRALHVWTAAIPADRVYAVIDTRREAEIVADVHGLTITKDPDHQPPPGAVGYDQVHHQWWVRCDACGGTHYGADGAAGVLPVRRDPSGTITHVWLARRARGTDHAGTWAYPGGALDPGEDPWDAAAREYAEETGQAPSGAPTGEHTHRCGDWTYTTFTLDAGDTTPTVTGDEHTDSAWFPVDDLPDSTLPQAADTILAIAGSA